MVIPLAFVEMGHHALALEAPLYEMGFGLWANGEIKGEG